MNEMIYKYFTEISQIPRETYHIEGISNYLVNFAKENNLEVIQDESLNVIIKKEASEGYSDHEPIIIQGHMDMVCQKTENSSHNFSIDPIELIEENGYLRANQTTLGADNGIGMAMALTLLTSNVKHPKLEVVFTVNEEVGMDGAIDLNFNNLESKRLINIDSEDEGVLTAGCAGGIRVDVTYTGDREKKEGYLYTLTISNLLGGHSGMDINKNRVNAIMCIGGFMSNISPYCLESIQGGKVDNAIPDSCTIKFLMSDKRDFKDVIQSINDFLKDNKENKSTVSLLEEYGVYDVFTLEDTNSIMEYILHSSNGVISYEDGLDDLVKTSLNFGVITTKGNEIIMSHSVRSSSDEDRDMVVNRILENAKAVGASMKTKNPYSGWSFNEKSELRNIACRVYKELFHRDLIINVVHAGLECGIFISKRPNLDCISIGPTILGAHTPEEMADIQSVNRTYDYLVKLLENM